MAQYQGVPVIPAPIVPQSRRVLADPVLAEAFRTDGFARAMVLRPDDAAALRLDLEALRPLADVPHGKVGNGVVDYHCSAMDPDVDYRRRLNAVIRKRLEARVAALLDGYRLLFTTLYVKRVGQGTFPMHYNWPVLPDLNDTSVTIWMPLVATDGESGGVRIVPGSHKLAPHINGPTTAAFYDETDLGLSQRAVGPALDPGEALIFDDCIIHGSSPNRSGALRPAIQLMCVPEDAVPVFYHDRHDGSFEMIHADTDFWVDTDFAALAVRQPEWVSLGVIKSRNLRVDAAELDALIEDGANIRAKGVAPAQALASQIRSSTAQPLWRRALATLRGSHRGVASVLPERS